MPHCSSLECGERVKKWLFEFSSTKEEMLLLVINFLDCNVICLPGFKAGVWLYGAVWSLQ